MGTTYKQVKILNTWLRSNTLTVKANTYNIDVPAALQLPDNIFDIPEDTTSHESEPKVPVKMVHIVQSGENLWNIAKKYGVTSKDIMQWNNLSNPSSLKIDQELIIERVED